MSFTRSRDTWEELAGRVSEGLEISLLWNKSAGRLKLAVGDTRLDEHFEFDVADADGLTAFYHPFAYTAGQGFPFGNPLPEFPVAERSAA